MFSVKVLFSLFLSNIVLDNPRCLSNLPSFPICLLFSVSSHYLFFLTTTWICSLSTCCPRLVPIRAPLSTLTVPHRLVPAKQVSCDLCSPFRCLVSSVSMCLSQRSLRFRLVETPACVLVCPGCLWREEVLISGLSQLKYKQCWFTSDSHRNSAQDICLFYCIGTAMEPIFLF